MVEGAKYLMQVPVEMSQSVLSFLTAKYATRATKVRGEKPIVWAVNTIGEISVKGLPEPEMVKVRHYVAGVIDGLSGVGFRADEDTDAEAEEV